MNDHKCLWTPTNVWRSPCDHCKLVAKCIRKPIHHHIHHSVKAVLQMDRLTPPPPPTTTSTTTPVQKSFSRTTPRRAKNIQWDTACIQWDTTCIPKCSMFSLSENCRSVYVKTIRICFFFLIIFSDSGLPRFTGDTKQPPFTWPRHVD